ncbi:MAG: DUF5343 domain-containing protein, partial [Chloroflexota bacterium]
MVTAGDFGGRRAPYAPISALERFFERIRNRSVPDHVDYRFLQKLNVASNNEYALLSALKFLGVLDDRGRATHAYRLLQSTDRFQDTLRHLVETAYRPVFDAGADTWKTDDLVNFFRRESSPSQAKNAARFFLAVCRLASIGQIQAHDAPAYGEQAEPVEVSPRAISRHSESLRVAQGGMEELRLTAKARLLEKLPSPQTDWSAEQYQR